MVDTVDCKQEIKSDYLLKTDDLVVKHKRVGSTGTTADEAYTSDDEFGLDEASSKGSYEGNNIRNGIFSFDDDYQHTNVSSSLSSEENLNQRKKVEKPKHKEIQKETEKISWESLSSSSISSSSLEAVKDYAEIENKDELILRLQEELKNCQNELKLRNDEVIRLSRIRCDVESEIEELTASLFEEAHSMVREANINQATAEKSLKESEMKVDVLSAEVAALKTLVLTSTPSCPNLPKNKEEYKKHSRSPSHFNLKYGRESSPPDSPVKEGKTFVNVDLECAKNGLEFDPVVYSEFLVWKDNPRIDKTLAFLSRVYREEIDLCLNFVNEDLTKKLYEAVENGSVFIEAISDKTKTLFPKKCALLEVCRICNYQIKFGDDDKWFPITQLCRNRITAVCNYLNYLRYIERGLVKSTDADIFWEITRLRKEMNLARLGLPLSL